jgi:hypothetical protein
VSADREFRDVEKEYGESVKVRFYHQQRYAIILIMIVMGR